MPVYEFACPRGHVVEDLVPVGTAECVCRICIELDYIKSPRDMKTQLAPMAQKVLSPTPTTFRFADTRRK